MLLLRNENMADEYKVKTIGIFTGPGSPGGTSLAVNLGYIMTGDIRDHVVLVDLSEDCALKRHIDIGSLSQHEGGVHTLLGYTDAQMLEMKENVRRYGNGLMDSMVTGYAANAGMDGATLHSLAVCSGGLSMGTFPRHYKKRISNGLDIVKEHLKIDDKLGRHRYMIIDFGRGMVFPEYASKCDEIIMV